MMCLPISLLALLAAGPARAARPPMTTTYRSYEEYALRQRRAAPTTETKLMIDQGGYLTQFDAEWVFSSSICASWLEPNSHSTIYERCYEDEECGMLAFPYEDGESSLISLVGCVTSSLPASDKAPITTMYPYSSTPSTGCWASDFGCCHSKEPYPIVITNFANTAAMWGCATSSYDSVSALGFWWNSESTITPTTTTTGGAAATSGGAYASGSGARTTDAAAASTQKLAGGFAKGLSTLSNFNSNPTLGSAATADSVPTPEIIERGGLGGGAIAGIVIGAIFGVGIIAGVTFFLLWRMRKKHQNQVGGQPPPVSHIFPWGAGAGGKEKPKEPHQFNTPDDVGEAAPMYEDPRAIGEHRPLSEMGTERRLSELSGIGKFQDSNRPTSELPGSPPTLSTHLSSPSGEGAKSPNLSTVGGKSPKSPLAASLSADGESRSPLIAASAADRESRETSELPG